MSQAIAARSAVTRQPAEPMKPIIDPADWTGETLPGLSGWQFHLTPSEAAEVDAAVQAVRARGMDIKDITRDDFPLPNLEGKLAEMKEQAIEGTGIVALHGLDISGYGMAEAAAAFWGVGVRLGNAVPQNHKGHVLGHVSDLAGKDRSAPHLRAYHTSAELGFHADSCDILGLMCIRTAKAGGQSRIVSTVALYNEMLRRRPDLVEMLCQPWFRDRREEIPPGKQPWWELPVFCFEQGYFSCFWSNYYIRSCQRFEELPRFTDKQVEALDMMDEVAEEIACDNDFKPGMMVFLHNHVTAHARAEYEDWEDPERRRHLLRLWLATPNGRPLPEAVLDRYVGLKPGQRPAGIVVEGMKVHAPLEPE